jgi:hypothetical protein
MKKSYSAIIIIGFIFFVTCISYGQAPPNDNCANATLLTSGSTCTTGLEAGGTVETGEIKPTCGAGGNQNNKSVWYKFVADSTSMYVQMYLTGILNGTSFNEQRWALEAYNTATCIPGTAQRFSPDRCTHSSLIGDSDNIMILDLNNLVVGNTYLLQVYYQPGNGTPTPQFCIQVGKNYTGQCNTCSNTCGAACQFSYTPTSAAVKSSCAVYNRFPYLEGSLTSTQCYTFTATSANMNFEVEIDRQCTVSSPAFPISWNLYNSSCGSLQTGSGTYGSTKTFTNLTIGESYTFCYSFTSDSDCYISAYYPYVYPNTILPIQLSSFTASQQYETVALNWTTESETNNEYFSLEHSTDAAHFAEIVRISGAGTSSNLISYKYIDNSPAEGLNYYRLIQHDFDGTDHYSNVISADVHTALTSVSLIPNPVSDNGNLLNVVSDVERQATLAVFDATGRITLTETKTLHAGKNVFGMNFSNLPLGIYNLMLFSSDGSKAITFIK